MDWKDRRLEGTKIIYNNVRKIYQNKCHVPNVLGEPQGRYINIKAFKKRQLNKINRNLTKKRILTFIKYLFSPTKKNYTKHYEKAVNNVENLIRKCESFNRKQSRRSRPVSRSRITSVK